MRLQLQAGSNMQSCLTEAIEYVFACLYAKLFSPCKGMLIHPLHVLLNVSVKFFIGPITTPLYQMCVLYAVSWRPAVDGHLSIYTAHKHAGPASMLDTVCHAHGPCQRMLSEHAAYTTSCQGSSREGCFYIDVNMTEWQHLGVSANVQRGNLT